MYRADHFDCKENPGTISGTLGQWDQSLEAREQKVSWLLGSPLAQFNLHLFNLKEAKGVYGTVTLLFAVPSWGALALNAYVPEA